MHRGYIRRYTLLEYGVTRVLTFDQPLWVKVQHILDAEPSTGKIKNIVLRLVGLYMEMSFLDYDRNW